MEQFDVVIIGSGPGGYVGAIKAAQLGLKTAVVEKASSFGGTCLNVGCIPTKVMIHSAEFFSAIKNASSHGIVVGDYSFDMRLLSARMQKIVTTLTKGVGFLFKKNNVASFKGIASIIDPKTVRVESEDGKETILSVKNIVIATGSVPKELPHIKFDGKRIISSTEMLHLEDIPSSLAVIGAGAVGVEFASIYATLGSNVTVVEMLPHLLPLEDEEISRELERAFRKRKIRMYLSSSVKEARVGEEGHVMLVIESSKGESFEGHFEKVLLAVGRAPYTEGLNIEKLGIETRRGFIKVDEYCRTNIPGIYAIGDVIPTPQLAHVGSAEGILVARHIAGQNPKSINYLSIPSCTYSSPQVASAGLTEEGAKEKGINVRIGKFPFSASGKARIEDYNEGFIKVVTDGETGEILGVHMIGGVSTELIGETVLAMNLECRAEDLADTIHPHPTISEALMEAAHAAHDKAIHF